jgi:D-serine deaminase-like pyridoxal phosphate-dependent protein
MVSIGSTPTATFVADLQGVSEVRAGVYTFFDLFQAGLGVCRIDDIAISVLATIIGHNVEKGIAICDAGWMAISRDRSTNKQAIDQGYGLICDVDRNLLNGTLLSEVNQEHGIIRVNSPETFESLPVGALIRILPNHACSTAGQHSRYHVFREGHLIETWERFSGW